MAKLIKITGNSYTPGKPVVTAKDNGDGTATFTAAGVPGASYVLLQYGATKGATTVVVDIAPTGEHTTAVYTSAATIHYDAQAFTAGGEGGEKAGDATQGVVLVKTATPTATPPAGVYVKDTMVTLSGATGATLYYTADESAPTAASTEYDEPVKISATATLKVIAVKAGHLNSTVLEATYTVAEREATPVADPVAGAVAADSKVTLTAGAGAAIYYTIDGTEPTAESTLYEAQITIAEAVTIKAIATKDGSANSLILTAAYTIAA